MRDAKSSAWFWAGRILPRRLRERVFEPAYFDLVARTLREGRSRTFGVLVVWTALESLGIGLAGAMIQNRRPTPAMWRMLALLAVLSFWILARVSYGSR